MSWDKTPGEAREQWHTEARERDEAQLADGPSEDGESAESPWAGAPLPGLAQEVARDEWPGRDFRELSESGLLWLINAVVFHPRGFALALSMDTLTGTVGGWELLGDGTEPWRYAEDIDARFAAAEATLAAHRKAAATRQEDPEE